jgi:N-acetylglucosamine kinase-like BadF-type ATPase
MERVLAVDGGNTKTLALVADLEGTILGAGRAGCGDIYNATPDAASPDSVSAALANIELAVRGALRAADAGPAELAAGVFNMAGADWPEDIALLRDAMRARGFGRTIVVQNDALGVLHAASPEATGVSVVCGTGAATGARAPDGRVWHSSFWQDEVHGSAQMGRKTFFAVCRAALGIEPPTSLTPRVLEHFGVPSVEDVLRLFHAHQRHVHLPLDPLTAILLDEADAGDAVALAVVRGHGAALGNIARAAARQVELEGTPFRLVLAGGVFRHPTTALEDAIVARVRAGSPDVRPLRTPFEPIAGVVIQALAAAGVRVDQALLDRVIPTIPAGSLTSTISA